MAGQRSRRVPASRAISSENLAIGIEYYTDLGPVQSLLPFNEQQHNIYAVVDFKIGRFDVNAGVGYGLTQGFRPLDDQDDRRHRSQRSERAADPEEIADRVIARRAQRAEAISPAQPLRVRQ